MIKRFLSFLTVLATVVSLTAAQDGAFALGAGHRAAIAQPVDAPELHVRLGVPSREALATEADVKAAVQAARRNPLYREARNINPSLEASTYFQQVNEANNVLTNKLLFDLYHRGVRDQALVGLYGHFDRVHGGDDGDTRPHFDAVNELHRRRAYALIKRVDLGRKLLAGLALTNDELQALAQEIIAINIPPNESYRRLQRDFDQLLRLEDQYNNFKAYVGEKYINVTTYVTQNPGKVIGGTILTAGTAYGLYRYYHRQKALFNKQVNAIIDLRISHQAKEALIKARKSWSYFWHWNAAAYDTETLARLQHVPTPHAHAAA